MRYEPLACLNGAFIGSQLRWPVVDTQAFAVVSTLMRLTYMFWMVRLCFVII